MQQAPLQTIDIRHGDEWAEAYLKPLRHGDNNGVQLTIHSSYGCHGYLWHNIGQSRPQDFLARVSDQYIVDKLFPRNEQTVFDRAMLAAAMRKEFAECQAQAQADAARRKEEGTDDPNADSIDWEEAGRDLEDFVAFPHASFEGAYVDFKAGGYNALEAAMGEGWDITEMASSCRAESPTVRGYLENIWHPFRARMRQQACAPA